MVIAPGRAKRPGAAGQGGADTAGADPAECPFCEGHEERTPPETFAVTRDAEREPDTPGWTVRVVPNLYPALARQEVVVHSPRHVRSVGELEACELDAVAVAWQARARAGREAGLGYLHAFVNEGREAGASLAHSHSQLAWLPEVPPAVTAESSDPCRACDWLAMEQADETRVVEEHDGILVATAYAGRLPYECLIAPLEHPSESAFDSELLGAALRLLARTVQRLRGIEGPVPLNAWLHGGEHWHLELVPRLSILAGLELGAGVHVNTLAPEEAARRLRGQSADS